GGVLILLGFFFAVAAGYLGFVVLPRRTGIGPVKVLLVFVAGLGGLILSRNVARSILESYNVAEVNVKGPIMRDARGLVPSAPTGFDADDVVDQIEAADDDPNTEALLVKLNTPGGEVVPSDDIRLAVEEFDGPTVGYATDVCASGGYWIASACDIIYSRETSLVGSIGVLGS
ncbi:MAG: S49 family peptidase, partial [Halobacteria archaeon]|nr:S49 family peptidase [Halobacteria archaeon]